MIVELGLAFWRLEFSVGIHFEGPAISYTLNTHIVYAIRDAFLPSAPSNWSVQRQLQLATIGTQEEMLLPIVLHNNNHHQNVSNDKDKKLPCDFFAFQHQTRSFECMLTFVTFVWKK